MCKKLRTKKKILEDIYDMMFVISRELIEIKLGLVYASNSKAITDEEFNEYLELDS